MDGEIHAAGQHKDDSDDLNDGAVVVTDARIVRREARGCDSRKRVTYRVEQIHPGKPIGEGAGDREHEINDP